MAAMRAGMAGTDDYLTQCKAAHSVEGDAEDVAEQEANRLETEYDKALILGSLKIMVTHKADVAN